MGSWKLGRFAGIDVSVHWTLVLLLIIAGWAAPQGYAVSEVAFMAAIFACVLLHEFGHALAARQFGIGTHSIVMLPIGGVASLERIPRQPLQELWIAVAGPLVNVAIAAALYLMLHPLSFLLGDLTLAGEAWLTKLMYANIVLVAFNMLPAFPMDGGRVLRATLAMRMPYVTATQRAAGIGRFVALGLGVLALAAGHLMLLLAVGFVILAGAAEARMVAQEAAELHVSDPVPSPMPFTRSRDKRRVVWDAVQRRYRYAGF